MKFTKPDLHLLVVCVASLVLFAVGGARVFHASNDLVPVYAGARCLVHGCDPYAPSQLESEFFRAGGMPSDLPSWQIDVPVYPPSTFLALAPIALLRFPVARFIWFLLNGCLFATAAGLILSSCPPPHRWLATILVSFFVLTAGISLVLGQPAVFAISLVVIGSCLFLGGRLVPLGAFLFFLSLAVKPQIGGFIVLYFVAQRIYWRYAAFALAGAAFLLLWASLILGHHPRSAGWASTLRGNLSATLSPGGSADPRPANPQAIGDENLQALTSIFVANTGQFNATAYAIFLALLGAGTVVVLRANRGPELHLMALGALSILTLMPIYHRFYDTRLLLLSVPAVLVVFQSRRVLGSVIAVLTVFAAVSIQYRVQVFLLQQGKWQSVLANKFLFVLLLRHQNLIMLLLFLLYLAAIRSLRLSSPGATDPSPLHKPAIPAHR
jgi:hypothetical protein